MGQKRYWIGDCLLALALLLSACGDGGGTAAPGGAEDPSAAAEQVPADGTEQRPEEAVPEEPTPEDAAEPPAPAADGAAPAAEAPPAASEPAAPSGGEAQLPESPAREEPSSEPEGSPSAVLPAPENPTEEEEEPVMNQTSMKVQIGTSSFTAVLEHNTAVDALVEMMEAGPVTIRMSDYAGFEKVGPLGTSLPASNRQTTTQAGDIVLYQGNQIVIFYVSNSWSYTRLGRVEDLTGWEEALGSGDVTVTFSLEG